MTTGGYRNLIEDLSAVVRSRDALIVVGAGLSIAVTNDASTASWKGLLRNGIERCLMLNPSLSSGWQKRLSAELDSADIDDLLAVGQKVSKKLGAPDRGEWRRWLREAVGALKVVNREPIDALHQLQLPIATTNYDDLIESVTGRRPISYTDHHASEEVIDGDLDNVLHLHGHWKNPQNVVLGITAYESLLGSVHSQSLLRAMRLVRSVIFIGFGAGLDDPNFSALRSWSTRALKESERRSYQLVLDQEVVNVQALHNPDERIFAVGGGDDYEEYWRVVARLGATPPSLRDSGETAVVIATPTKDEQLVFQICDRLNRIGFSCHDGSMLDPDDLIEACETAHVVVFMAARSSFQPSIDLQHCPTPLLVLVERGAESPALSNRGPVEYVRYAPTFSGRQKLLNRLERAIRRLRNPTFLQEAQDLLERGSEEAAGTIALRGLEGFLRQIAVDRLGPRYFRRVPQESYSLGKLVPLLLTKDLLRTYDADGQIDVMRLVRLRNRVMHHHPVDGRYSLRDAVNDVERIVALNSGR